MLLKCTCISESPIVLTAVITAAELLKYIYIKKDIHTFLLVEHDRILANIHFNKKNIFFLK